MLGTLAKGNARFGDGAGGDDWQIPLESESATRFVSDPRTICVIAIDMSTNHIAGFVYGGVLNRRHTKLEHLCVYELGVDIDHRQTGVGELLLGGIAAEARQMGIDRGFVITTSSNTTAVALYEGYGAVRSPENDILFGLQF